ncbi:MAG TPA: FAD-dependent oxidoreductase [Xanthobacteraceae bacterium]|nr:FAD-dependent oxidoreductase [Xanthobacteraceae bacterium]
MSKTNVAADPAPQASLPTKRSKKVTVVGAGIAGLTTAYRLAQRGYDVTIFEGQSVPGGNLAGMPDEHDNTLEVYPHMFGNWYDNFWELMADIGVTRERHFEARPVCGYLQAYDFPHYRELHDAGSLRTMIPNMLSGIMSIPNMFLAAYAIIDLLTQDFDHDDLASEQSLNGFIVTRPYATLDVARFFQALVLNIWSVYSYSTSAAAYQAYAKYQFRRPAPQSWVLRTNSYDGIVVPLRDALKRLGCRIYCDRRVVGATVNRHNDTVLAIAVEKRNEDDAVTTNGNPDVKEVENLVLAITPTALPDVIMRTANVMASVETAPSANGGPTIEDVPIVQVLPELANTRALATAPILVIYATFNLTLPDMPEYYVALAGSRYSLTFVKSNALSKSDGKTTLVIAASDFNALPADLAFGPYQQASSLTNAQMAAVFLILQEFHRYVPKFKLGNYFGDLKSDICWNETTIRSGVNQKLFINEVGSRRAVPYTHYPAIKNLYFAGQNRDNPITIATVEAAVCSGNQAAQAICRDVGQAPGTAPVNVLVPETYSMAAMLALKFALAPYAAAAKCWATLEESLSGDEVQAQRMPERPTRLGLGHVVGQAVTAASDMYCGWLNAYGSAMGRIAREFGKR